MRVILSVIFIISSLLMAGQNTRALIGDDYPNSFLNPAAITINSQITGKIETGRDFDVFWFKLSEADGIVVDIKQIADTGWINFAIYKQDTIGTVINFFGGEDKWNTYPDLGKGKVSDTFHHELEGSNFAASKYETFNVNLKAGAYYIVIYSSDDTYIGEYNFNLKSYGENVVFQPDQATITYCKNTPSLCGITTSATPPTAPTTNIDCNTKAIQQAIYSGWNLVGTSESNCTFEELKKQGADAVYAYENGSWITSGNIKSGRGFWIKKNSNTSTSNIKINQFSRNKNIVTDNSTGLMWQDDISAKSNKINYEDAILYCSNLTLSSYVDWRLPSIDELKSILDTSYTPTINPIFQNTATSYRYLTVSSYKDFTDREWIIWFDDGYTGFGYKRDSSFVRCVRSK